MTNLSITECDNLITAHYAYFTILTIFLHCHYYSGSGRDQCSGGSSIYTGPSIRFARLGHTPMSAPRLPSPPQTMTLRDRVQRPLGTGDRGPQRQGPVALRARVLWPSETGPSGPQRQGPVALRDRVPWPLGTGSRGPQRQGPMALREGSCGLQ